MKMNESASGSPLEEYDFERRFDEREALEWMQENWWVGSVMELFYCRSRQIDSPGQTGPVRAVRHAWAFIGATSLLHPPPSRLLMLV